MTECCQYEKEEKDLIKFLKPKTFDNYKGLEETASGLCGALIARFLKETAGSIEAGKKVPCWQLMELVGIRPKHARMFKFFLRVLESLGLVKTNENDVNFLDNFFKFPEPEFFLAKIQLLFPDFKHFFSFLEKATRHYPKVFKGEMQGAQVLFPKGDSSALEIIYQNTPKLGYEELYLHLLKEIVTDKIRAHSGETPFSLLEIGGGQGILTDVLLTELNLYSVNYTFTDIGAAFVNQARNKYKGVKNPAFTFKELDASRDPLLQNISSQSYEVLVGFNVVHATKDILKTLTECAKLVRKGGSMLFVENCRQHIWIDMLYGVTEGWWDFEDSIRVNSPLLTIDQWNSMLAASQFAGYQVYPADALKHTSETCLVKIEV